MTPVLPFRDMLVALLPKMRAYATVLTRSRAAADDLLQQTAYRALRGEAQFELGTNFRAWMYRILKNEHLDSVRRSKSACISIDVLPEEFLAQSGTQEETLFLGEVLRAVARLPRAKRELLALVAAAGLSYAEAAQVLNLSIGTVKSRMSRARADMNALLACDGAANRDAYRAAAPGRATTHCAMALDAHMTSRMSARGVGIEASR